MNPSGVFKFTILFRCLFVGTLAALLTANVPRAIADARIALPDATYAQPGSDQGVVLFARTGRRYIYWANGALVMYPSGGRRLNLGDRRIDYVHWSSDHGRFIIGSATGDHGTGWAWLVDADNLRILRRIGGNVVTAWCRNSAVGCIKTIDSRQIYVEKNEGRWLPLSIRIVAASENGSVWLARTDMRHDHGYRGNLVVFRNARGALLRLANVKSNAELADEPSELISSDGSSDCVVTTVNNQAHISTLCSAYYIDIRADRRKRIARRLGADNMYFSANVYRTPNGYAGICRQIDDAQGDAPKVKEFRYTVRHGGRLAYKRVTGTVAAYSADNKGREAYIVKRNGKTMLSVARASAGS